jgi:hypothetical protein
MNSSAKIMPSLVVTDLFTDEEIVKIMKGELTTIKAMADGFQSGLSNKELLDITSKIKQFRCAIRCISIGEVNKWKTMYNTYRKLVTESSVDENGSTLDKREREQLMLYVKKIAAGHSVEIEDFENEIIRMILAGLRWRNKVCNNAYNENDNEICTKRYENLQFCTKCYLVQYCSRKCQTADWPTHKLICGKRDSVITEEGPHRLDLGSVNRKTKVVSAYNQ